jgi:RNA polymerase sigma factor (sigma-70 family)
LRLMDLETLLKTREFLDDISISIRNIILASFPNLTLEEREDVDNEVKLKLWRKVARGKKIDNLRSYLWRVVYTTALDLIAEKEDHLPLENILETANGNAKEPEELLLPDHASKNRENRLSLEKAVAALPERRKAVVRLYLSGHDIPQIADSLRWRENQVRHLLYRGLADLRKAMSEDKGALTPEKNTLNQKSAIKKGGNP